MKTKIFFPILIVCMMNSSNSFSQIEKKSNSQENLLYIGTYTKKEAHVDGQAEGIYSVFQDPENGSLRFGETVAEITNPSFVKVSNDGRFLYAVSELTEEEAASGFVYSFKINEDKSLEKIGKLSTEGFAPCHIAIDKTGKFVFVSNYLGGVVMVYEKNKDGSLKKKQHLDIGDPEQSHTHSVTLAPDNTHFYVADLGEDRIWIFDFDADSGSIKPHQKMPFLDVGEGEGPRHFSFSKNADFLYVANELGNSVSAYKIKENVGLELTQNLKAVPKDFTQKNSPADIHVHPSGRFLYLSNRGHNSIAAFKIDSSSGKLTSIGFTDTLGKTPRNFSIGPKGKFLYVANQDSSTISIFKIDSKTGELQQHLPNFPIKTPVCIEFY